MNLLIIALVQLIGAIIFIIDGIVAIIHVTKRKKYLIFLDNKMLTFGRIFTWGSVIAIISLSRTVNYNIYYLISLILLIIIYICGSRLYVLSFRVKEENKDTFYYSFDQWLEKIYRKYLAALWKDKE
ncbi:hypothetical protein ACFL23_02570 [Patescibacteria group bacterium]